LLIHALKGGLQFREEVTRIKGVTARKIHLQDHIAYGDDYMDGALDYMQIMTRMMMVLLVFIMRLL